MLQNKQALEIVKLKKKERKEKTIAQSQIERLLPPLNKEDQIGG